MSNEPVIGDILLWKNKNTNTIEEGKVHSIVDDTLAIGDHYVSWIKKSDIEVIEYIKKGEIHDKKFKRSH